MMSIDKYSSTFSLKTEIIVFIFVKIFVTSAFFKIGEYSDISHLAGHIQSRDAFRPIACWVVNM